MVDRLEELMTDEFDIPMGIAAAGCASDAEVGAAVVYFTEGPGVDHPKRHHLWRIFARLYRDRALRESHDALRDSLQEFAEGPWHNSKCAGWSEYEGETEYDMRTVMRPELCDCAISRARAALAKAEALQ